MRSGPMLKCERPFRDGRAPRILEVDVGSIHGAWFNDHDTYSRSDTVIPRQLGTATELGRTTRCCGETNFVGVEQEERGAGQT